MQECPQTKQQLPVNIEAGPIRRPAVGVRWATLGRAIVSPNLRLFHAIRAIFMWTVHLLEVYTTLELYYCFGGRSAASYPC